MYIDFMTPLHKKAERDYLARVNDPEFPKARAAELAKQFGFDYWDGDRRVNYGGYRYMPGRWTPVAEMMIEKYSLSRDSAILDVGCGKGFLMFELQRLLPGCEVFGLDISRYAIDNAKNEVADKIHEGSAVSLPWGDNSFDFVFSINTLHCLQNFELSDALSEIQRVGRHHKYICVESFRNESEKANLLYWQVTCETFASPEAWEWWFEHSGYDGDHSFIFFE